MHAQYCFPTLGILVMYHNSRSSAQEIKRSSVLQTEHLIADLCPVNFTSGTSEQFFKSKIRSDLSLHPVSNLVPSYKIDLIYTLLASHTYYVPHKNQQLSQCDCDQMKIVPLLFPHSIIFCTTNTAQCKICPGIIIFVIINNYDIWQCHLY